MNQRLSFISGSIESVTDKSRKRRVLFHLLHHHFIFPLFSYFHFFMFSSSFSSLVFFPFLLLLRCPLLSSPPRRTSHPRIIYSYKKNSIECMQPNQALSVRYGEYGVLRIHTKVLRISLEAESRQLTAEK